MLNGLRKSYSTLLMMASGIVEFGPLTRNEIRATDQWMAEQLIDRRLLLSVEGDGLRTVGFRDPVVVERWEMLRHWIDEDRPFLLWRAAVTASLESWRLSQHDEIVLLRGKLLDKSPGWLKDRPDDLNDSERELHPGEPG